jgi:hypothetical protein
LFPAHCFVVVVVVVSCGPCFCLLEYCSFSMICFGHMWNRCQRLFLPWVPSSFQPISCP